jgi:transposase
MEVGAEWLCLQALGQLGISNFLKSKQWSDDKINLAQTHIISRAVYPASELKTVSWIKENSSVCELTGFDKNRITKDLLYGISKSLFQLKEPLEQFLSKQTNELFDLQDTIILYDLTNTYFEGQMKKSKIARFGRSKEKRSDAKLIVLAVVINQEGFLKYSNIFEGNTTDSSTLESVIDKLSSHTSVQDRKPIL